MKIRLLLDDWGQWARVRLGTEFPSVSPGFHQAVKLRGPRYHHPAFSDVIGETVDRAVSALASGADDGEQLRQLLYLRHVYGLSQADIAERFEMSTNQIRTRLSAGHMWVSGCLVGLTL